MACCSTGSRPGGLVAHRRRRRAHRLVPGADDVGELLGIARQSLRPPVIGFVERIVIAHRGRRAAQQEPQVGPVDRQVLELEDGPVREQRVQVLGVQLDRRQRRRASAPGAEAGAARSADRLPRTRSGWSCFSRRSSAISRDSDARLGGGCVSFTRRILAELAQARDEAQNRAKTGVSRPFLCSKNNAAMPEERSSRRKHLKRPVKQDVGSGHATRKPHPNRHLTKSTSKPHPAAPAPTGGRPRLDKLAQASSTASGPAAPRAKAPSRPRTRSRRRSIPSRCRRHPALSVLMVTSEAHPFAKTGGSGGGDRRAFDALAQARALGHTRAAAIPRHRSRRARTGSRRACDLATVCSP